jgi:hypothetical protein
MFERIILVLMLSVILLGAAVLAIPIPVLWGTACLFFLALSVAHRRQQLG